MNDHDDVIEVFIEDPWEISGALDGLPAFTCQPVTHRPHPLAACAAACRTPRVKPASRLMFTPWLFGHPIRLMNA